MQLNPNAQSVTYRLAQLAEIETSLNSIERLVLSDDSTSGIVARGVCSELNQIRDALGLQRGVQRHDKFKT